MACQGKSEEALTLAAEMAANPVEPLQTIKRLTWQHIGESDLLKIMTAEMTELGAATQLLQGPFTPPLGCYPY